VPVWAEGPFADRCVLARKRSSMKSEIVKTEAGDREEESLVKEKTEGRA
jgi:hypothetical protein